MCARSSVGVVLRDLDIIDCGSGALLINGSGPGAPPPTTALSRQGPPPDVLLRRIRVMGARGRRGAGLAVASARIVLHECEFARNQASGCGGAVHAQRASLLLLDSNFTANSGNGGGLADDGGSEDECRGGALQVTASWLGVARSRFTGNSGVNGSALLLLKPVGVAQLQDSIIADNAPRQGAATQISPVITANFAFA